MEDGKNSDGNNSDGKNLDEDDPKSDEDGKLPANSLLAQLAQERASRQQQRQRQQQQPQVKNDDIGLLNKTKRNKKKKKSKGKGKTMTKFPPKEAEKSLDGLDDMAFLDAQIEKSQNSHGRQVVGSGKNYRTIVNGILNSRPEPRATPRNGKASSALQAKLREAGNARKKKKKK